MLSPTILSINWFFSFILLRHLDGIQRNSQASIFRNTMVHRIFLYFLSEKREGLAFERLKFASSTTGPSEKQDTRTNAQARIIGLICRKGLGTSRADVWGNARHFCDGELNFTPEFNYRIREKALRNESLETNNARDCLQSCGYLSKWTSFLPFRVQLQDVRHPT